MSEPTVGTPKVAPKSSTEPTEEQVAWAIASIYGETCAWGREKGRVCGLCDCNGMTEAYARQAARAVLALLPQRVAPSRDVIEP